MCKNSSGFSLIELVIIAAMLAILAAMAAPQLAAYTVQGDNATAAADLRNAASAEKAFFSDWGVYASSAPGAASGMGAVLTSYANSTGQIWASGISPTAPSSTIPAPGFQIGISQNVQIVINTSVMGGSYTIVSKNASSDRCFGMDSDTREVYWVNGYVGVPLFSGAVPAASANVSDFAGIVGSFPCNGLQSGQGQLNWVAL